MRDRDNHVLLYDTLFEQKGETAMRVGFGDMLVIPSLPDTDLTFGRASIRAEALMLKVRSSECPDLSEGDVFQFADGRRLEIQGAPRFDDRYRLVWVAEARSVGAPLR